MSFYRASARSNASDQLLTSVSVTTPGDVQSGDMAVFGLLRWESTTPPVTPAAGCTLINETQVGSLKLATYWGRVGDTPVTHTFTWSGQTQWTLLQAMYIARALSFGDPVDTHNHATETGTAIPTTTVTTTGDTFLVHFNGVESAGSQTTVPTNFTVAQTSNVLTANYRAIGPMGTYSAANGVWSTSTSKIASLIAIKSANDSPVPADSRWFKGSGMPLTAMLYTPDGLVELE